LSGVFGIETIDDNKIDENIAGMLYEKLSSEKVIETIAIPQVTQLQLMEEREEYETGSS